MQLGRKLRAGRASADDRDVELTGSHRSVLRIGAQTRIDQAAVEARGLLRRFERYRVFRGARGTEIVGHAAGRHHEEIIGQRCRRRDFAVLVVVHRGELQQLRGPVDTDHLAETIDEMMPMRLGEKIQFVLGPAQTAGRDGMQQRLPQMCAGLLDKDALRLPALAERVAQSGHEFKSGRAAADHHNARRRCAGLRHTSPSSARTTSHYGRYTAGF